MLVSLATRKDKDMDEIEKRIGLETSKKLLERWKRDLNNLRSQFNLNEKNLLALIEQEEANVKKILVTRRKAQKKA